MVHGGPHTVVCRNKSELLYPDTREHYSRGKNWPIVSLPLRSEPLLQDDAKVDPCKRRPCCKLKNTCACGNGLGRNMCQKPQDKISMHEADCPVELVT